ncbi:hypothetical protein ABFP60_08380 [Clostridioides difficile]
MKKLINKINMDKIEYGVRLMDKGLNIMLSIAVIALIILIGVKNYSIEKHLNNNKEAIANYKWSISSIDFVNKDSKDESITKLTDKSIGKTVSFLNESRVIIAGRGFDYDFNSNILNLDNEGEKITYKIDINSSNKISLINDEFKIDLKKIRVNSYEDILTIDKNVKKEVLDIAIENVLEEKNKN